MLVSNNSLANWRLRGEERDGRESGSDMCKSVTYTALLQAHLQQQVKILLCLALTVGSPAMLKGTR